MKGPKQNYKKEKQKTENDTEKRERERERESGHEFSLASLFAITLCHNIRNFSTVCGNFSARHDQLPAKPPPRHNFFQLLVP
jgi:hypothetical protein